ncbi:MAG: carbamoyltransferase HypF, partial [Eudoraea sp.]|nr:carbamoyltransferase HypF [Eudoraea sp.]
TSIVEFTMCEACEREYSDPLDRRFNSQTNSCAECGITIQLMTNQGVVEEHSETELYSRIAALLNEGNIIAVKNTSGYLLCCDATNPEVVQKLRERKNRPTKPFAILYPKVAMLENEVRLTPKQRQTLASTERPVVIISKGHYKGNLALQELAPGLNQLGIMVPYTGILALMAEALTMPIVATSGNLHGSPIISDSKEAFDTLRNVADYFIHHNLHVSNPQDDSVVKYSSKFEQEVIFRRSRGYAPNYFGKEHARDEKILAMGGHLKSALGFLPNDYVYLSQYLGNLDNYDVYQRFESTADKFIALFEQQPDKVLVDAHPGYHSTQLGMELGRKYDAEVIKIQHHKAHFASVLGEHELFEADRPVLGVIWDGTGYGEDKHIWGGEFFSYRDNRMERLSHFEYFDWLAGDKMALEPRLSFLSLSDEQMEEALAKKFTQEELAIYKAVREKNRLQTSSVGRLFDAVASVLNLCDFNTYEGEAAILLENYIRDYDLTRCYPYIKENGTGTIPTRRLFSNLYQDYRKGTNKELVICNFLYTLATQILEVAKRQNFKAIAFSGGVFQNTVLIDMLIELAQDNFELFFNRNLSPNDENISYGQLNYYLYCKDH